MSEIFTIGIIGCMMGLGLGYAAGLDWEAFSATEITSACYRIDMEGCEALVQELEKEHGQ